MRAELYRFIRGATIWTFTSSDTAIVYNLETYIPITIGHGERKSRTEMSKANLEVSISLDSTIADDILSYFGNTPLIFTLFIQTDLGTEVGWKGRYLSQKLVKNQIKLTIESIFTALRRPGLRARYQKNCRHALYYTSCGVDKSAFAITGELTDITGSTVTVAEAALQPDGWFLGGMIKSPTDDSLRWIVNHVGSILTLVRPFETLTVLDVVTLHPGCDHTRSTCLSKFSNVTNYGGFPWIPHINPFAGTSIV